MKIIALTFSLLFSSLFSAQVNSVLQMLEGEMHFSDARVYLFRNVPLSNFPILDLSAETEHGSYFIEDSCHLESTKAYQILKQGFKFEGFEVYDPYGDTKLGNYSLECSAEVQYKIIVRDPLTSAGNAHFSEREPLKISENGNGHYSFEKSKGIKPSKKEVLSKLDQLIKKADSHSSYVNMSAAELYKLPKEKSKTKPNWSMELDRIFIKVKPIVLSENGELVEGIEEESFQYVIDLKQNSSL